MTNRFLISAAVAALIAGTGFANAQGTGTGRDTGAAGSTAQQTAPSSERGSTPDMKSTQSEQKSMGAEKSKRAEDQKKGGKEMKVEGKEGRGDMKSEQKGQTVGQGTMQRDQSTTPQRDQTTTQGRDQTSPQKQDRMQTQTQGGAAGQATTTTGQAGAAGKLSTEQRTQITTVIKEQRVAPVTNVNFSLAIGTKVPRSGVTFHPLPARVVTIYPQWRGYEFILVNDQIVVINPRTLQIVAILEA